MDQGSPSYIHKGIQGMLDMQRGRRTGEGRGKFPSITSKGEAALPKPQGPWVLVTFFAATPYLLRGMGIHPRDSKPPEVACPFTPSIQEGNKILSSWHQDNYFPSCPWPLLAFVVLKYPQGRTLITDK